MTVSELKKYLNQLNDELPVYCGLVNDKLDESEKVVDVIFAKSLASDNLHGVYLRME